MHKQLWRVCAPHFVAGVVVRMDGSIAQCAPILGWLKSRGEPWSRLRALLRSRGYEVTRIG